MSTVIPRGLSDTQLRDWLIQEIANIDIERRNLKAQIGTLSRTRKPGANRDEELREAAEELLAKFQTREDLRILLGDVNARIKATNRRLNNARKREVNLATAFMNVAEEMLDPDVFAEIEQQALKVLESNR